MLLKGVASGSLRMLAYVSGIYVLKKNYFFSVFWALSQDVLDRSNIYLEIGYRKLQGK